ncbi:unnamed protein product [Effrenium voratum]|nr:unnamed protein product [Effrenium voratum]
MKPDKGRVRYQPEPLEAVEEIEDQDGCTSDAVADFAVNKELAEFRRKVQAATPASPTKGAGIALMPSPTSRSEADSVRSRRSRHSSGTPMSARPLRHLELMPTNPWCGKCMPQPLDGQLPVKPEQLATGQQSSAQALFENVDEFGTMTTSPKRAVARQARYEFFPKNSDEAVVKFHNRQPRIEQLGERLSLTATHPMTFFQRTAETPDEIELMPSMTRSRFSSAPFTGYDVQMNPDPGSDSECSESSSSGSDAPPKILTRLTTLEVSRMELVTLNHAKTQSLIESTRKEGVQSARARRTTVHTKFASLWQLLKRRQDGTISKEENYYLMSQLRFLPFFSDIPPELYDQIVDKIFTDTYVPGCHLFEEGEEADSVFMIITGEVKLRNENAGVLAHDSTKAAPCVLLGSDVFSNWQRGQPFTVKPKEDRIRSMTAVASGGDMGPSTTVAFSFPVDALECVSQYYRKKEAADRWHIVRSFAKSQRLSAQVCQKHQDVFTVKGYPRSYLFVNAGTKPSLEEARILYVMEGELQVVHPARKDKLGRQVGKGKKERVGKGYLIGDAVLYGEPYPSAVVSTSDVKVLVVKASDYLHKLLNRSVVLPRPEGYQPTEGPGNDAAEVKGRRKLIKDTTAFAAKTLRMRADKGKVKDNEWKAVAYRQEMPGKIPPGGHQKMLSLAKSHEAQAKRLEEGEVFLPAPKVPIIADVGRSGDGYLTRFMQSQLSERHEKLKRLQAAHRSHTAFHYHVEEIGGSPLPSATVLCASPGSRMLMACGAMSPRPKTSPEKGRSL